MYTLANLVAIVHGIVVVYFVFSLFILIKNIKNTKWYIIPSIPMLLIQWFYILTQGSCPLTILENHLRSQSQYKEGFICHYWQKLFGFSVPDRMVMFFMGIITMIFIIKFFILPYLRKNPSPSS